MCWDTSEKVILMSFFDEVMYLLVFHSKATKPAKQWHCDIVQQPAQNNKGVAWGWGKKGGRFEKLSSCFWLRKTKGGKLLVTEGRIVNEGLQNPKNSIFYFWWKWWCIELYVRGHKVEQKSNLVTFCRRLSSHKGLCLLPLNQSQSGLCSGLTLAFIAKQLGCSAFRAVEVP